MRNPTAGPAARPGPRHPALVNERAAHREPTRLAIIERSREFVDMAVAEVGAGTADLDPTRARSQAERYNIPCVLSPDELRSRRT